MANTNSNVITNLGVVIQDVLTGTATIFDRTMPTFTFGSTIAAGASTYTVITPTGSQQLLPTGIISTGQPVSFFYLRNSGQSGTAQAYTTFNNGSGPIYIYLPPGAFICYGTMGQDFTPGGPSSGVLSCIVSTVTLSVIEYAFAL